MRDPEGFLLTEPFLAVCRSVLPVVGERGADVHGMHACMHAYAEVMGLSPVWTDNLGTAFVLVRTDINGNIEVGVTARARCSA